MFRLPQVEGRPLQTRFVALDVRLSSLKRSPRGIGGKHVSLVVELGKHLAFLDPVVEVDQQLRDLPRQHRADLDVERRDQGSGCHHRLHDIVGLDRPRDILGPARTAGERAQPTGLEVRVLQIGCRGQSRGRTEQEVGDSYHPHDLLRFEVLVERPVSAAAVVVSGIVADVAVAVTVCLVAVAVVVADVAVAVEISRVAVAVARCRRCRCRCRCRYRPPSASGRRPRPRMELRRAGRA